MFSFFLSESHILSSCPQIPAYDTAKEEEEYQDDDGLGDNNEDASVHIMNSLYNTSPVPAPGRIRRRHGKTRIQQCNFCNYTSKKMSNIKMHVKNVHKSIERGPDDTGFTTVFI